MNKHTKSPFIHTFLSITITFLIFISFFVLQLLITAAYFFVKLLMIFYGFFRTGGSPDSLFPYLQSEISSFSTLMPDYEIIGFLTPLICIIVYGVLYYLLMCRRASLPTLLSAKRRLHFSSIFMILICGCFMQIYLSIALCNILPFFEKTMNNYINLMSTLTGSGSILSFIKIVFLAPIAEELMFRGLIQKRLASIMPATAAIILQAFLFGLYHLNIVQGIYVFLMGIAVGYLFQSFKTIKAPILFHMTLNGASYIVSLAPMQLFYNPVLAAILFAFTFMTNLVLIIYMVRSNYAATSLPQSSHAEAQEHNSLY